MNKIAAISSWSDCNKTTLMRSPIRHASLAHFVSPKAGKLLSYHSPRLLSNPRQARVNSESKPSVQDMSNNMLQVTVQWLQHNTHPECLPHRSITSLLSSSVRFASRLRSSKSRPTGLNTFKRTFNHSPVHSLAVP